MCSHYSCFSLPWSPKVKSAHPTFPRLCHRTTVNPVNASLYYVFKPKCRCLHLSLAGNTLFVPFPIFLECYYQIKEYVCFCGSPSVLLSYSWKWHNLFIHSTTNSEVGLHACYKFLMQSITSLIGIGNLGLVWGTRFWFSPGVPQGPWRPHSGLTQAYGLPCQCSFVVNMHFLLLWLSSESESSGHTALNFALLSTCPLTLTRLMSFLFLYRTTLSIWCSL